MVHQNHPEAPIHPDLFAAACLTVHMRTGHPGNQGLGMQPDQESRI